MLKQERNWRSNCQHPWNHRKSKRIPEKHHFCNIIDYTKAFNCVDHNKLWKILQEMGMPDHLSCLLWNLYAGQEATVRTRHRMDWFQIGKEYVKIVYCHPACLISMQNTSCKMPDWMKHKLESRLQGDISITSDKEMTPPLWQNVKRN